ncbi:thioredoxin family protein [Cryobacterium sp. CG_9.6]|uniref:thioredoxin family protein n=1 Tax=Cryobacterium sp. CG_9.6 TaxID=2760710 RepID=UPI0024766B56|nr:thioredoxin family protein [Cryobacterium sp. CG_9.6]MDH6237443.1 glutaredoxin [Cryobacterium sp. CG_9.6]
MHFTLYTSAFCEPCAQTRAVLAEAHRLIPRATFVELDVAAHGEEAEANVVRNTPTVIITRDDGTEVYRAHGVPTLDQVLVAAAKAL